MTIRQRGTPIGCKYKAEQTSPWLWRRPRQRPSPALAATWRRVGGPWGSRAAASSYRRKPSSSTSAAKINFPGKKNKSVHTRFGPKIPPLFSLLDCGGGFRPAALRPCSMNTVASLSLVPRLLIKPSFRCLSRKVRTHPLL